MLYTIETHTSRWTTGAKRETVSSAKNDTRGGTMITMPPCNSTGVTTLHLHYLYIVDIVFFKCSTMYLGLNFKFEFKSFLGILFKPSFVCHL
jgi:hypothetical protein